MRNDPGQLDNRIAIVRNDPTKGSSGQLVDHWVTFLNTWAKLVPGRGVESMAAGAETQRQTMTFQIRYRAGITPEMGIVFDGRTYDIEDIAEPEGTRRQWLLITGQAREVTPGSV